MHSKLTSRFATLWNSALCHMMIRDKECANRDRRDPPTYDHMLSTLNAIPDLMFELDENGQHLDYRVLQPELLVAPPDALLGHTVDEVMPPNASKAVMAALQETKEKGYSHGTHIYLPTPVGNRWFEVSMARKAQKPGEAPRFIALSRDITERKLQHIEAERLAYVDVLTELPNRHAFMDKLKAEIGASNARGYFSALLFLDLDNFKTLNDTKGHSTGDQLLKVAAKRLRDSVRESDLVIRWGGDEFVIFIGKLAGNRTDAKKNATLICDNIVLKTNVPYELEGHTHCCPISIGVSIFDNLDEDIEGIIERADHAMYTVKKSSKIRYAFDESI